VTVLTIGGSGLAVPEPYDVALLSSADPDGSLTDFVRTAPDATIYHQPAYVDFARRENSGGDLVFVRKSGNPIVALPLYEVSRSRLTTGYAGVLFPDGAKEGALRRGVDAIKELIAANPRVTFEIFQSAQAVAASDLARTNLLVALIDASGLPRRPLYTRVLELPHLDDADDSLLKLYDADARNQIRQAARHGLSCRVVTAGDDDAARVLYERYLPIHVASWGRTGLTPHSIDYWMRLSRAIRDGGGVDFGVFAEAPDGEAVAAVTCHAFHDRAIYWSGASLPTAHRLRANPFCLHGAIAACARMGVRAFEVGRFSAAERDQKERTVTDYKRQFGGEVWAVPNVYRASSSQRVADAAKPVARRLTAAARRGR
jgi:hypothetical protein